MKCLTFIILSAGWVAAHAQIAMPDWVLESTAPWQARDSQAEWVFKDQLWIGGGWFQSFAEPPRDVWASGDGKEWKMIEKNAPWLHSDLPMNIAFADKMWISPPLTPRFRAMSRANPTLHPQKQFLRRSTRLKPNHPPLLPLLH